MIRKRLTAWIISAVLCLCMLPITASANTVPIGSPDWDTTVKGSVTTHLIDAETGKPLTNGALTLYRFAETVGNGSNADFVLSDDYAALELDLTASETYSGESAVEIWRYLEDHQLGDSGLEAVIGEDGTAVWDGLEQGMYLVVQTEMTKGYMPISPYIVVLPYQNEDEEYVYDVVSIPKSAVYTGIEPAVIKNPPVRKTVKSEGEFPKESVFRFRFRPVGSDYPMPVNNTGSIDVGGPVVSRTDNELILQLKGEGTLAVGEITFYNEGKYFYEVSEIDMKEEGFSYDGTVYRYEFDITETENKLVCERLLIRLGDADGKIVYDSSRDGTDGQVVEFAFENSYDIPEPPEESSTPEESVPEESSEPEESVPEESSTPEESVPEESSKPEEPPEIVNTGQLWWPVPVLFLAGAALVLTGAKVRRAGGKDES